LGPLKCKALKIDITSNLCLVNLHFALFRDILCCYHYVLCFFQFGQHVLKKTKKRSLLFQERRKSASPLSGFDSFSPSPEAKRFGRKLSEKEQSPLATLHSDILCSSPVHNTVFVSPECLKDITDCSTDIENVSPNPDIKDVTPVKNRNCKPLVRKCSSPILGKLFTKAGPRSSSPLANIENIDNTDTQDGKCVADVKCGKLLTERQCTSVIGEKKNASPLTERNQ